MALATPYYSTGNGTTGLNAYRLADSVNMMMAADSDVGNVTIYEVDWTFITLGAVAPASDGTISVASHGLSVGDTVYIAASAGSVSLKSGAYVVHTVPSAGTFTVYGLSVSPGDTLNYLAKVNETAGAIPF